MRGELSITNFALAHLNEWIMFLNLNDKRQLVNPKFFIVVMVKEPEHNKDYDYLADIQEFLLKINESSASEILIILGEELIATCCTGIIETAKSLGSDLQEFLGSLDGVYESRRYRYFFSSVPSTEATSVVEETLKENVTEHQRLHPKPSTNAIDLCMSSQTFCKAFPWHFIMNESLELVQLGES